MLMWRYVCLHGEKSENVQAFDVADRLSKAPAKSCRETVGTITEQLATNSLEALDDRRRGSLPAGQDIFAGRQTRLVVAFAHARVYGVVSPLHFRGQLFGGSICT